MVNYRNRIALSTGASLVEFAISAPVLFILGLSTVQIGFIYHAKVSLNYATFEGARTGAVNHANLAIMRSEVAYRLAPVQGGDGSTASAAAAIVASLLDTNNPSVLQIDQLNPTKEMFDAWGIMSPVNGVLEIPNHHLRYQDATLKKAGVTIHDANLLKIRSTYGYVPQVPVVGKLFLSALKKLNPHKRFYYDQGRLPLISYATVRMQNEAWYDDGNEQVGVQVASNGENSTESAVGSAAPLAECDEHGLGVVRPIMAPADNDQPSDFCEVAPVAPMGPYGAGSFVQSMQSQFEPCA